MAADGTIRSRMEAQRDRHPAGDTAMAGDDSEYTLCAGCYDNWPCPDRVAADDTLTDLNNADTAYGNEKTSPHPYWRLIWDADGIDPDPDSRDMPNTG